LWKENCFKYPKVAIELYLGKKYSKDGNSALNVIDRLIVEANLHTQRGRIAFTDNWYTSVDLAKQLYMKDTNGHLAPTEKKARKDYDVPFLKLSNGALKLVTRGWYREAVAKVQTKKGGYYKIQCTTWRDKKQVMFLHTAFVSPSKGSDTAVQRHVKGKQQRANLSAPIVQREYAKHCNAVDINDMDSSDYTCSIRTARCYLRIFFWLLDRAVLSLFIIICSLAQHNTGDNMWKRFRNHHKGRKKFQIALAMELMIYAIERDWKDAYNENEKLRWMRQSSDITCGCNRCSFCINGKTSGMHHNKSIIVMTAKMDEAIFIYYMWLQ